MFTHRLPASDKIFQVEFSGYSKHHFLKKFKKKHPGKQWLLTEESIKQDLSRINFNDLQLSQQVDELWNDGKLWVFKYDFRVAGTKESTKSSGNRLVGIIDLAQNLITIIVIYHKTDLPGNISETQYINGIVNEWFQ